MLLRTVFMSLDPYMRGRMNDAKSYAEPVKIDEVMTAQVVSAVVTSNIDGYETGDYVLAGSGCLSQPRVVKILGWVLSE